MSLRKTVLGLTLSTLLAASPAFARMQAEPDAGGGSLLDGHGYEPHRESTFSDVPPSPHAPRAARSRSAAEPRTASARHGKAHASKSHKTRHAKAGKRHHATRTKAHAKSQTPKAKSSKSKAHGAVAAKKTARHTRHR